MSKHIKPRKATTPPAPQRPWWLWAVVASVIILVVSGLALLLIFDNNSPEAGRPKVVVDQAVIDEGYQKLNKTIRTSFTLRNEGDATLQILGEPQVELVEGC